MNTTHTTHDRLEAAAREAASSLNARGRYASAAIDKLALRGQDGAEPVADGLTGRALDVARRVRDGSDHLRLEVSRASERAAGYVRDQPVRSMLMAMATGALLYAAVRMLGGRSR